MLKITTDDKKITVDRTANGVEAFALNSLAFALYEDGVTIYTASNRARVTASPINKTSVNGTLLTADTALEALSALMTKIGGSGGGSGDQVQADYTERDTTAASYIKNKPYTELPQGTALPATANAGDRVVYKNTNGDTTDVYEYDGFVWTQTATEYNLIFKAQAGQTPALYGYDFKKEIADYYLLKMKEGVHSSTSIVAATIEKIENTYSLENLGIVIQEEGQNIALDNVEVSNLAIDADDNDSLTANSVTLSDICSYNVNVSARCETANLSNIRPLEISSEGGQVSLSVKASLINVSSIQRPSNFMFSPKESEAAERTISVDVQDVQGVATSSAGGVYVQGTRLTVTNTSTSIKTDAKVSIKNSSFETLFFNNYNASYGGSSIEFDITLSDYALLKTITLFALDIGANNLDTLFDAVIADATTRASGARIELRTLTGYTLSEDRITALQALGFNVIQA